MGLDNALNLVDISLNPLDNSMKLSDSSMVVQAMLIQHIDCGCSQLPRVQRMIRIVVPRIMSICAVRETIGSKVLKRDSDIRAVPRHILSYVATQNAEHVGFHF